ncbi:MAG: hypothetical protein U0P45_07430 [Acidimicrobiales bacterium]
MWPQGDQFSSKFPDERGHLGKFDEVWRAGSHISSNFEDDLAGGLGEMTSLGRAPGGDRPTAGAVGG